MKNVDDKDLDNVSGGVGGTSPPDGATGPGNANPDTTTTGGTTADPNETTGQGNEGANENIF